MIPNGWINFNAEIQVGIYRSTIPTECFELIVTDNFFFSPSGTVNHLPFGLALLISFHKQIEFSTSNMKSTSQIINVCRDLGNKGDIEDRDMLEQNQTYIIWKASNWSMSHQFVFAGLSQWILMNLFWFIFWHIFFSCTSLHLKYVKQSQGAPHCYQKMRTKLWFVQLTLPFTKSPKSEPFLFLLMETLNKAPFSENTVKTSLKGLRFLNYLEERSALMH